MIVFDLKCLASGDRFEAWFRSSAEFELQLAQGLVLCPVCVEPGGQGADGADGAEEGR